MKLKMSFKVDKIIEPNAVLSSCNLISTATAWADPRDLTVVADDLGVSTA